MSTLKRLVVVTTGILALALPVGASAQFPFTEKPGPNDMDSQETLKFKAGSGVGGFGTQVGPYTAQVLSYPGQPLMTVYCVDFLHSISVNQEWTVNVSTVGGGDLSKTRLGIAGAGDALSRYKKGAWLASQFMGNQNQTSWKQIHSAIWTTVIAGNDPTKPYFGQFGDWLAAASAAEARGFDGMDFSYWQVLTDVRADDNGTPKAPNLQPGAQEYLVHVTPEPETIVMLMTGLLVLGLVVFRRGTLG